MSGRAPWRPTAAEVLLTAVTVVAVSGFTRLFADRAAVAPLLVAAVVAHLVAAATRRAGLGAAATSGVLAVAAIWSTTATIYPHTSVAGLPGQATLEAIGADAADAWDLFGDVVAPAPTSRGFLLASALAIWVAVALADWAAFRLRAVAEAILPALALFIFTVILGRGPSGVVLAAALAAAGLGFAVASRTARAVADDVWVDARARDGGRSLAAWGAGLAVLAAVGAGVAVPRAPGADQAALVDWRRGDTPASRLTVSPLVDIRSRLVQQSDAVVFRVEADAPAYWRLTSLPRFDGEVWSSSDSFSKADGRLPGDLPDAATDELEQRFSIEALGTIWAPAALTPVELVDTSTELRWNGELATLIVPARVESVDGARYTVRSSVPRFDPDRLTAPLPSPLPDELAELTELPVSPTTELISDLAREVVAGAGDTPYTRALALQEWFRSEFDYDLEGVGPGHGRSAIEEFLAARRGYCEQFAGTFAAMARTLGIPSRVAVGFTPGELDAERGSYTVRGRNAHAWPEVHIPGAGWVPFEPTPGRGQPGAEAHTGVTAQQDPVDPPAPTTAAPTPTTTAPPSPTSPADPAAPTTDPARPAVEAPAAPPLTGGRADPGSPATWAGAAVALIALVAAGCAGLVAATRRRRGRPRSSSGAAQAAAAWWSVIDAARQLGVAPAPAQTDIEAAAHLARGLGAEPALNRRLHDLATQVTAATWSADGAAGGPDRPGGGPAGVMSEAHRLRDDLLARRTGPQRLRAALDPRTVAPPPGPKDLLVVGAAPRSI